MKHIIPIAISALLTANISMANALELSEYSNEALLAELSLRLDSGTGNSPASTLVSFSCNYDSMQIETISDSGEKNSIQVPNSRNYSISRGLTLCSDQVKNLDSFQKVIKNQKVRICSHMYGRLYTRDYILQTDGTISAMGNSPSFYSKLDRADDESIIASYGECIANAGVMTK
ncbi:hypothetical protein [Pseudoalteromonas denitrificans]|jgi:hypothetical protein|uniref:Uncharacterized protein n=1 Tax=Pseudoalteromonas denitrificans DSM 6059 TaxID=1123010 RepID=A0A1I1LYZ8_9GAMM|nr:hypothetical protein [Pseudoalteromonas denitrificans]SFC76168.1 hypothetical protein SAMN02745724_02496 [Pseudoalteromonas denitrificans DSM 6059]